MVDYNMKLTVKKTGLSAHLIRMWERRYQALQPQRTATNRRVYTEAEIERLRQLKRLTEEGYKISELAGLKAEQLKKLLQSLSREKNESSRLPQKNFPKIENPKFYVEKAMESIVRLESSDLECSLQAAAEVFEPLVLMEEFLSPLLQEIGERWQQGVLQIAEEHLASTVIRHFLENLQIVYPIAKEAPRLLISSPAGQIHEFGALFVAKIAAIEGWNSLYLGANLPAEEIVRVSLRSGANMLALSLTYTYPDFIQELEKLAAALPQGLPWVCGGRACVQHERQISQLGATVVKNLKTLRLLLKKQKSALQKKYSS